MKNVCEDGNRFTIGESVESAFDDPAPHFSLAVVYLATQDYLQQTFTLNLRPRVIAYTVRLQYHYDIAAPL